MPASISAAISRTAGRAGLAGAFAVAMLAASGGARAEDPIVGTWVGNLSQADQEPFETRVTFVSPKGGVSRYPGFPCGGVLSGDRKGDAYEYEESISWGGVDELDPGCISGTVRATIDGDKMNLSWSGTHNGQEYQASGELKRVRKGKR